MALATTERSKKLCFVAMGFGKKTHYPTGRMLDLDATYEAIIKPAAEAAGLRCIRADEVRHSGIIDARMYELLFQADVVIADISTDNVNAVYELGIRHALCPKTTIVMVENQGQLYFDLNHVNIFRYTHLGEDIGAREACRASRELQVLIEHALNEQQTDSPVYTFLRIERPQLSGRDVEELINAAAEVEGRVIALIREGENAKSQERFVDAATAFAKALEMTKSNDTYLIQQLAFATYKSKSPSPVMALTDAREIIHRLDPLNSNDPETLGIAGAIHKNLWLEVNDVNFLEHAIAFYGRGFEVRRDYYNGENLALCFNYRSMVQEEPSEAEFDRMSARKVREAVLKILTSIISSQAFEERSDKRWVYASMANCLFATMHPEEAEKYEALFMQSAEASWEIETYEKGKQEMLRLTA